MGLSKDEQKKTQKTEQNKEETENKEVLGNNTGDAALSRVKNQKWRPSFVTVIWVRLAMN